MAASSSSSSAEKEYDVFISFRGEDTRYNFTSHLVSALSQNSVRVYVDYELRKGDEILPSLINAIHDSYGSLVIFSENYASSRLCLNELLTILEQRKQGHYIVPVFYNIDPLHVRKQAGSYANAFAKHEANPQNREKLHLWRAALVEAANIFGWDTNRDESKLIGNIVNDILQKKEDKEIGIFRMNLTSTGNNPSPKVRKPYTITKQREKWTEEEHQKFLEALKLYGRGWRQIEEHIGTKTALQIRSHAQKFFFKVARESNGSAESSIKPTDKPPPRPKRKPLHPYPRKSVDSYKGQSVSNESERSPSPNLLVAEKDTKSPTSVLSALNSEAVGSAFSEQTKRCLSPNSCTTDIHSGSVSPVRKENDCMTSNSSEEELKLSLQLG